ncbi:transcription cofactor HES-6 [Numida meleagris]|uniref:transcription cofactor HES-6 n=1 Tax=Numida meleagris TaxID=8996 RepID=UPI000B3D8DD5|nr:transcription cofactor HES-6 [Numida meleagris]
MLLFGSVCWGNCSCQLSSASSYRTKPGPWPALGSGGGTTRSGRGSSGTAAAGCGRHPSKHSPRAARGAQRGCSSAHGRRGSGWAAGGSGRAKTKGSERRAAGSLHPPRGNRRPHRAFPSCTGRAEAGGTQRGAQPQRTGGGRGAPERVSERPEAAARKPLVEKKRRARINESLQELRQLLAGSKFQAKLENAEVLELTVRRVQAVLERRALEGGRLHREASERFAAGYIQCMHEVHTFVSSCPGIDATTAAELLNHLLESMPLSEGGLQDLMADVLAEPWLGGEAALPLAEAALGLVLPTPSPGEETCSDSDEAETEPGQTPARGLEASQTRSVPSPKSMWRPW